MTYVNLAILFFIIQIFLKNVISDDFISENLTS